MNKGTPIISDDLEERVARQLPEAPHWNGFGKYGPALCMDNWTLHIMSRGFGAKDGDGYVTHDPAECDWERDEDGKDCVVVPVSNSDLLFLRDKLNELFPVTGSAENATEAEADEAITVLERAIEAARNSNQAGENAVVRAAAALRAHQEGK